MSAIQTSHLYCQFRVGWMLTVKRLLVLLVAFATTTGITALGILNAGDGVVGGPTVAITGILALLLLFGVQVDRIELGPLTIDFNLQAGNDDDTQE